MLEIIKKSTGTPFIAPATQRRIEDVPPEQICFTLQQMRLFYRKCEQLSLPVSNQIAFFSALHLRFGIDSQRSLLEQDVVDYLPLMLLYSSYGNHLFCAGERSASDLGHTIESLMKSTNIDELRTKVREQRLEPVVMQQASLDVNRRAFVDGAEFFHWEDRNRDFAFLQEHSRNISPLNVTGIFFCPRNRSISWLNFFMDYYISHESIVPNTDDEKRLLNLRERLEFALEMRTLHHDYMSIGTDITKSVLQTYTRQLLDLLTKYPAGLAVSEQLSLLWKYYQNMEKEISFDHIHIEQLNKSKGRPEVRNAALILLLENIYHGRLTPLQEQLESLLQSYLQDPLYRFFTELHKTLELYPDFQPIAPVYIWRIFVKHAKRIATIKKTLFNGKTAVDFSWKPVFFDLEHNVLSEERKSGGQYKTKCDLFEKLVEFFVEEDTPYLIDKPMCEYVFQRLTQTELNTYSDTSVFGTPLRNKKPLYRGFALIKETLYHAADDLWMDMPRNANFPVPVEDAAHFYQKNYKHGIKEMQYLFEHQGGKPQKSKKVLKEKEYNEIVKITLLSSEIPEEKRSQILSEWMQNYINNDPVFRKYANISDANFGMLQFSIYRLAIERYNYYLTRDIFDKCKEMFYFPLPQSSVSRIWHDYFAISSMCWKLKKESDCIFIRNLKLHSRNLYTLNERDTTTADQWKEKIQRFCDYPCALILPEDVPIDLLDTLHAPRKARIFYKPNMIFTDALDKEDDYLTAIKNAVELGYDGIRIHGLRMDVITYGVLEYGISLNNNLDSINENELVALCQIALLPFCHLASRIRTEIGDILPLIFTIHIPTDIEWGVSLILRVLCRFLSDKGVDAIELAPLDMLPAKNMMAVVDELSTGIPIPILIDKDYLLGNQCDLLEKHAVTGFVVHHVLGG